MRRPSAGERSTLEPYFREVGPLPILTADEEVALAKGIEALAGAFAGNEELHAELSRLREIAEARSGKGI